MNGAEDTAKMSRNQKHGMQTLSDLHIIEQIGEMFDENNIERYKMEESI